MVRLSGHQVGTEIPIHFTGIREGEKLAEDLQNPEETASPTAHPSILRLTPTAVPVSMLDDGTRGLADLVVQRADHHAAERMAALAEAGHNTHHLEFDAVQLSERRNRWSPSTT
jgi:FlaA1/EpsC-like NDP-sugar epimerase